MLNLSSVIVTGATGVTGNALVRYLIEQGIMVLAIIRTNSRRRSLLPIHPLLTIIECDLENIRNVDNSKCVIANRKFDVFFHLAWEGSKGKEKVDNRNNMYLQSSNITYVLDAVELCNKIGCNTFVGIGSQAEYGIVNGVINESTEKRPITGYGAAKMCACTMSQLLCKKYNIRHIWARLFSVYGPNDGTYSMIDSTIMAIFKNEKMLYSSGNQVWNYLYSKDAAKALVLLAKYGISGEEYCVAGKKNILLKDYIAIMYKSLECNSEPQFCEDNQTPVIQMNVDTSKLTMITGFTEDFTFEQGIKAIRNWYQEIGYKYLEDQLL